MDLVLQALADPTRRKILAMLRAGPITAGRIAGRFDVSRPAVSRHLRVLRESGLVRDEESGRERHYHLDPKPLGEVEALLAELRSAPDPKAAWERRFMALETEVHRVRGRRRAAASPVGEKKRKSA